MKKLMWFGSGVLAGLTSLSLSFGSIPKNVTNDTVLYQKLSEIRVRPEEELNFDGDIAKLAALERRYNNENLPALRRLKKPMKRVSRMKYRSGKRKAKRSQRRNR